MSTGPSEPRWRLLLTQLRRTPRRLRALQQRLGYVGVLAALWVLVPSVTGLLMLAKLGTLAALWKASSASWASFGYPGLLAIGIGLGFFPVASCNLLFGWVYGVRVGLPLALATYLVGATIGFVISRNTSHDRVDALIEEHPEAQQIRRALLRRSRGRTLLLVTLWRSAGFPFPFSNLLLTSCGVRLLPYLLATFFGLAPRVAVATLVASTAAATGARDIQDLVRRSQHPILMGLGALLALGVLMLITQMARAALHRASADPAGKSPPTMPTSDGK